MVNRDFAYALHFAMHLAKDSGHRALDVRHMLAGFYITALDKIARYWGDAERLDDLVIDECGLTEPRWACWLRAAKEQDEAAARNFMLPRSPDLNVVWETAMELARTASTSRAGGEPIVCAEDFLLAVAKHQETDISKRVMASGLNVAQLEEAIGKIRRRSG